MSNKTTDIPVITTVADPDAEVQIETVEKLPLRQRAKVFVAKYKTPLIVGAGVVVGAVTTLALTGKSDSDENDAPLELGYTPASDDVIVMEPYDNEIA